MSNGIKQYGLIGYPVKHSLSSFMHNAAFAALGLDAEYKLFEVGPEELESFLDSLSMKNIYGLNITIPYKERILDFKDLDSDSFYVKKINAVNTIARIDKAWKAFNTDAPGFLRHLKENVDPIDKRVAVLGAGGAGKAVVYTIAESKPKEVVVYDIDINRGNALVNTLKSIFRGIDIKFVDSVEQLDISNKELLINATPVGMKESDTCLVPEEMLHKNLFVYDVIYNPPETKLLRLAKKVGARTSNGLGMLLYQGMLSFEIWTGKKAPQDVMREALNSNITSK